MRDSRRIDECSTPAGFEKRYNREALFKGNSEGGRRYAIKCAQNERVGRGRRGGGEYAGRGYAEGRPDVAAQLCTLLPHFRDATSSLRLFLGVAGEASGFFQSQSQRAEREGGSLDVTPKSKLHNLYLINQYHQNSTPLSLARLERTPPPCPLTASTNSICNPQL
jgi:hypothetical protein